MTIFGVPGDNIWKYLEHLETKVDGFHSKGAGTVNQGAGGRGQGRKSSTNAGGETITMHFCDSRMFCVSKSHLNGMHAESCEGLDVSVAVVDRVDVLVQRSDVDEPEKKIR